MWLLLTVDRYSRTREHKRIGAQGIDPVCHGLCLSRSFARRALSRAETKVIADLTLRVCHVGTSLRRREQQAIGSRSNFFHYHISAPLYGLTGLIG